MIMVVIAISSCHEIHPSFFPPRLLILLLLLISCLPSTPLQGNRKMLGLIDQYKQQYSESPRDRKRPIVEEIIAMLTSDGGTCNELDRSIDRSIDLLLLALV
jgi:hypothetical protein